MPKLILFEPANLAPFGPMTLLRSVSELRYGIFSNLERSQRIFPTAQIDLWVRPVLAHDHAAKFPDLKINEMSTPQTIFLNAAIPAWEYTNAISFLQDNKEGAVYKNGVLIAAKPEKGLAFSNTFHHVLETLPAYECNSDQCLSTPNWIWDYLNLMTTALAFDLPLWQANNECLNKIPNDTSSVDDRHIHIHNTAQIGKYIHLDASQGAIIIDADAKIAPFSSLVGPVYIGKQTSLKPSTSIRHSVVGEVCNMGGEIKGSIIHPYANKSHDGFLGDSILGSWVNLGAGTITSNLKNNYQDIRVSWDGHNYATERQFLGTILGDHSKTAIGVRLNTGTLIGAFCNVFQADFPPRSIPSFSWGNGTHELEKAIQTAKRVFQRRNITLSETHENLIRLLSSDNTPYSHF